MENKVCVITAAERLRPTKRTSRDSLTAAAVLCVMYSTLEVN
jgi:hypothetical protein